MEIHPNAFATELNKMIPAKIRTQILYHKQKDFSSFECAATICHFFFDSLYPRQPLKQKGQVAIAAIGIMTEFVRKSKKFQKLHANDLHICQRSVSERRQTSQCDHDHATEHRRFFPGSTQVHLQTWIPHFPSVRLNW